MQSLDEQPLVSVVIATYNMGQYLPMAVRSVLDGDYQSIEVIIIDDGSQDGTKDQLGDLINDPRVNYIYQDNAGQPKAKNAGVKIAKGEFIAFCDADDAWRSDKLSKQLPLFADPEVGVVYTEVSYIDQHGNAYSKPIPYERHSGWVAEKVLLKNFIPFGTAVVRKSCFDDVGLFDESIQMGIDWDLWLRCSLSWKFQYVSDATYIYREWDGQMSTNYQGRYQSAFHILDKFEKNYGDQISRRALKAARADNYISKGITYYENEHSFAEPLGFLFEGLIIDPVNIQGWKNVIKVILRWR